MIKIEKEIVNLELFGHWNDCSEKSLKNKLLSKVYIVFVVK